MIGNYWYIYQHNGIVGKLTNQQRNTPISMVGRVRRFGGPCLEESADKAQFPFTLDCREYMKVTDVMEYTRRSTLNMTD